MKKNKGTSGYSPVCLNQWQKRVCGKPKISCSKCEHKLYAVLDKDVIENHLRGNIVVGIYPMLQDETCFFLAMDFDEADWQSDISTLRDVCMEFNIPIAVERSRSGRGGHVWFFFENRNLVTVMNWACYKRMKKKRKNLGKSPKTESGCRKMIFQSNSTSSKQICFLFQMRGSRKRR